MSRPSTTLASEAPRRIGIAELEQRLGVERTTIWRWSRSGRLVPPHYVGNRRMWFESEIVGWERSEMARSAGERRGARNITGSSTPKTSTKITVAEQ